MTFVLLTVLVTGVSKMPRSSNVKVMFGLLVVIWTEGPSSN